MEKVYESVGTCPVCGNNTMKITLYRYDLPVEGPSILFVGRCSACGTRISDVIPLNYGKEVELSYRTTPEDLRRIVYLPGETEIDIPELGLDLRLTPAFKGRITTLEGVIRIMLEDIRDREIRKKLEEVAEGKRVVTVVLRNKNGLLQEVNLKT